MSRTQIVKKSYEIDLSRISEGYLYDTLSCFATTRNEARNTLLDENKYGDILLKHNGEEITYLTIPVIRNKSGDIVMFEDQQVGRWTIDGLIRDRNRKKELDAILNNEDIKYCYILKRGYYEPGWCGYTDYVSNAGVYEKEEAVRHARSVSEIRLEPINIVEHNKIITDKIKDLETRILK